MSKKKPNLTAYLSAPLSIATGFVLAILLFQFILKDTGPVPIFILFALIQVTCMTLFGLLPNKSKNKARMAAMLIIGLFLFVLAGLLGHNSFQIENFWFYLFAGTMAGVIVHLMMAKIVGPIFLGRSWCSWGCWSSMVFDLLPFKTDIKWHSTPARLFRNLHFFLSFCLVAVLVIGFHYTVIQTDPKLLAEGMGTQAEFMWLLIGNLLYWSTGILLAVALKDNRAFCKYLCPLTVFLRLTSRITLLRIQGNGTCTHCKTCVKHCPMGIDIPAYLQENTRVKSTECIMCMKCVAHCPEAILRTSLGFDVAVKDHLTVEDQ